MASQQLIEIIIKAVDEASATAEKVDSSLNRIGENTKNLGNVSAFDSMKTKLTGVASTIDGKFGNALTKARAKFDTLKSKVTGVATSIKGKLGSAVDGMRAKLSGLGSSLKNTESSFGFLRGAASMAVGMIGFELVNGLVEAGRNAINASTQLDYFTNRLGMSAQQTQQFKGEIADMQKEFRKVDMTSVAATASDISARMDLPIDKLGDVTRMTAVMSSEFVRNGRTQEDAVLAVADAMDGQFKRLQEIGITEDTLMKNGWNGDLNDKAGLVDALNKSMESLGYDDIAKDITTLDEAFSALSIAGGQLLSSILIPLTPIIIQVIEGFFSLVELVQNNAFVQGALLIGGLAIGFGLLAGAISVAAAAEGGFLALMPGFIASLYSAAAGFMAISVAGAPLWAIVAVVAAIALAVYEVGIAFGWWSDVGTMLEAISAGLQRMWNHFINHPDVQAAISMISSALSTLWSWIQQAGQAILEFFGIAEGGDFDIVLAIMELLGAAWDIFKWKIQTVISVVTALWNAINTAFNAIWSVVGPIVMEIVRLVQRLIFIWELFKNGQMSLPQLIIAVLSQIGVTYSNIMTYIVGLVVKFAAQMLQKAIQAGRNFVNGIINRIKALPGQIYSALVQVVSRIISAGAMWVRAAKQKAREIVDGAYNTLTGLPGRIASALGGVKDAIVKPFQDAYNTAKGWWDKIASLDLGGTAGFDLGNTAGFELENTAGFDLGSSSGSSSEHHETIDVNYNISLDLSSVPGGMNTTELINALTDKTVLAALTGNRDFQTLDAKVKSRINQKNSRAYGRGV